MTSTTSDPETWSPRDFALHGRFCPPEDIALALTDLRERNEAAQAVLLVADNRAVMQSLSQYSCPDADCSEQMRSALARVAGSVPELQDLVRPSRGPVQRARRYPASALEVMVRLRQQLVLLDPALADALGSIGSWVPVEAPRRTHGARMAVALLLQDPRRVDDDGEFPVVRDPDLATSIAEMVNCTVQASVRRDARTTDLVDRKISAPDLLAGEDAFATAAGHLVALARDVSASHLSAMYLRDGDGLRLVGDVASAVGVDADVPQLLRRSSPTSATACHERRAAVMFASTSSEDGLRPVAAPADPEETVLELATPIVNPFGSQDQTAAGVLWVARTVSPHQPLKPFDAYDYVALRNVALRAAMLRLAIDMEGTANLATVLERSYAADRASQANARAEAGPLPSDLRLAAPAIEDGLARIAAISGSQSATFRAALPTSSTSAEHGMGLRRIAASPRRTSRTRPRSSCRRQEA